MTHAARALALLFALLSLGPASESSYAGPPPLLRDLPGAWPPGSLRSRWIAPYVRQIDTWVAEKSTSRVTWFGPDGHVLREVEGTVGTSFVGVPGEENFTVHPTLADWTLVLPDPPPGMQGYVCAAGPRVFVRETWSDDGRGAMEVFTDGTLTARLGPLLRYRGDTVKTSEDGSLAFLTRASAASTMPRVAAFAPGGRPTFETDLQEHALLIAVAPGGRGALIQANTEDPALGTWSWATEEGQVSAPDLGANPHLLAWVPGTSRALIASAGEDPRVRFRLVDFAENRVVWKTQDPASHAAYRTDEQVAIEGEYVLLTGIECHVVDGIGHWRRSIYALDLATGKPTASWRSPYRGPPGYSAPRFVRAGGRLYLVSEEAFAPFPMDDLTSLTNGWHAGT